MPNIIREVSNSKQILNVIQAAFKRYEQDPMPSSALVETKATIEQELFDGVLMFGAEMDAQLVGIIKVTRLEDHVYFSRLAVLPEFQGQGIASALVKVVEQFAEKEQTPTVRCKVRKSEVDNIRLYKKLGFYIAKEEVTTSPLGFVMETVTMDKEVE